MLSTFTYGDDVSALHTAPFVVVVHAGWRQVQAGLRFAGSGLMVFPPGRVSPSVYEDKRLDKTGLRPLLALRFRKSLRRPSGNIGHLVSVGLPVRQTPAVVLCAWPLTAAKTLLTAPGG